jgi:DNA/RNA-binding domain of Phe-tRNA-synthetase-like protein
VSEEVELRAAPGFLAEEVASELPGLRLGWMTLAGALRDSPPELARRLADLSNRYRGNVVVALRSQPITSAYRSFFRQIGLDPDISRVPLEEIALARLAHGRFRSHDLVRDALSIALIETGVAVWALDASVVDVGGLGIRLSVDGDRLGASEYAQHLHPGRLAVADASNVHALLFGDIARGHEVTRRTERIALFSIGVDGVPDIHVEEALWIAVEALRAGGGGP